jgi:hypothetical protein
MLQDKATSCLNAMLDQECFSVREAVCLLFSFMCHGCKCRILPPHHQCTGLSSPPCRNAILLSERRAKERAERLSKLRAGQPTGAPKRSKEQQAIAKKFYGQLVVDSEYQV